MAAHDAGIDVEAVLKEFDERVQACIESRERYERKKAEKERKKEEREGNRGAGP